MAIDANKVFQFVQTAKTHGLHGRLGTLGVQKIHPQWEQIKTIFEQSGMGAMGGADLYRSLGFESVESLDISDYEGCTRIIDLNSERLPGELNERYDVIYNGGTLEHVFDLRAALQNIFRMLKPGGIVIHAGPANGWVDHGFYQFSPTFFMDYYTANRFDILEYQLLQYQPEANEVIVHTYMPGSLDAFPANSFRGRWGFYAVFRKSCRSISGKVPQQGYYDRLYGEAEANSLFVKFQYAPPYVLRDGCVVQENSIRLTLGAPLRGEGYEWMLKIPDLVRMADNKSNGLSPLQLWEDSRALGPPHSLHEDIRQKGGGRFSHWGEWIYFSTSDNCDPNGREYVITIPADEV